MTAINFVNAQLDADESVYLQACEQDKVAFARILFAAKERYQKEGKLDLGQLFDKLVRVFHIKVTTDTQEDSLQTAMAAHMKLQPKKFMLRNDNMKKLYPQVISGIQVEHNKTQEGKALHKKLKTIYDLKAEVGTLRKAMDQHGISTDGEP